ncbi:MAG: hypothetical protein ACMUJM_17635 [bacterium]
MTWPNVLALDYMLSTDQLNPEIEIKAREYINLGYQRLLTFEVPGGGFDWYGREPGKPILTAYGLMELADMERVHFVDPELIRRTQEWLVKKQENDGSWPPDERDLFNLLNNSLQSTAYATWALIHSGYSINAPGIVRGNKYIKAHVEKIDDNYTLALCANALLEGDPKDPVGLSILDRLEAEKIVEEDMVYWDSGGESFTYTRGNYLSLETTAMITYALIKAGWRYPGTIDASLDYIIQKKEASGLWGQTQATVLSLRVLMEALSGLFEEMDGEIVITINGQTIDKSDLPIMRITPIDSSVVRLIDLTPYTDAGDNNISITLIGEGNLLYQIVGTYFLPWPDVTLPTQPPLTIDLSYDRTTLTVDDTILCTVTVTNTVPDSVTKIGMIDLGIPPGFRIFWEDFEEGIEKGTIFKYESTNRQLSLYLHPVSYGRPLTMSYRLQAKYPLKVSTPKSSAFDYYNPGIRDETKPVILTVTDELSEEE